MDDSHGAGGDDCGDVVVRSHDLSAGGDVDDWHRAAADPPSPTGPASVCPTPVSGGVLASAVVSHGDTPEGDGGALLLQPSAPPAASLGANRAGSSAPPSVRHRDFVPIDPVGAYACIRIRRHSRGKRRLSATYASLPQ